MSKLTIGLLLFVAVVVGTTQGAYIEERIRARRQAGRPWGYRDADISLLPANWGNQYPNCNGTQQSPINIVTANTTYNANLTQLTIVQNAANAGVETWTLVNNGHSGSNNFLSFLSSYILFSC
jgi:hypothetical protein